MEEPTPWASVPLDVEEEKEEEEEEQSSLPLSPAEETAPETLVPAKRLSRLPTAGSRLPLPGTRLPVPRKVSNTNLAQASASQSIPRPAPRSTSINPPSRTLPTLSSTKSRETLRAPSNSNGGPTRKPSIPILQTRLSSNSLRSPTSPSPVPASPLRAPSTSIIAPPKAPVRKSSRYSVNGKVERDGLVSGASSGVTSPTSQLPTVNINTVPQAKSMRRTSLAATPLPVATSKMKVPSRVSMGPTLLSPTSPRIPKTPNRSVSSQKPPIRSFETAEMLPSSFETAEVPSKPSAVPAQNGGLAIKKTRTASAQLKKPISKAPSSAAPPDPPLDKRARSASTSLSLREQIAKAKAARAKNAQKSDIEIMMPGISLEEDDPLDSDIGVAIGGTNVGLLKGRIKSARSDGRLNISNMELGDIPDSVYKMYDFEAQDDADTANWFENVELTRFVATDNELETVSHELANQFGGLATIDLRNNQLISIPSNLPELTMIISLNLSNNKLTNSVLEIIVKLASLISLDLSRNQISGLPDDISLLVALEELKLDSNNLSNLPESINSIPKLKVLSVSSNKLETLPLYMKSSLVELHLASNKLSGELFDKRVDGFKSLQILDVKHNQLSSLSENESFSLPSIRQVYASFNKLETLPNLELCSELFKLFVDGNKLKELPTGIVKLKKLRNLDISSNNIHELDPHLGLIEALDVLKIDGNPLPHRRLAGLNTVELKKNLRSKLEPEEVDEEFEDAREELSMSEHRFEFNIPNETKLQLKQGGVLDLQNKKFTELTAADVESVEPTDVNTFWLQSNSLSVLPPILSGFSNISTLDLSHNSLVGDDYFVIPLTFSLLTNLILHSNAITSIVPILTNLTLPKIYLIDVHINQLTFIPEDLIKTFPSLVSFIASDNKITELDVESVDGLKVLDLSNNNLGALPARLGAVVGMRELRVDGNLFKVPRRQVLEKGTEEILRWLKDRIPISDREGVDVDE